MTRRCLSLWLSALLAGGLVVMAGYGLYGLCCWAMFPGLTPETAQWLAAPVWSGILPQLAGAFFFGMVAALLPLALAGVSKNACFILCAGFALFYIYFRAPVCPLWVSGLYFLLGSALMALLACLTARRRSFDSMLEFD